MGSCLGCLGFASYSQREKERDNVKEGEGVMKGIPYWDSKVETQCRQPPHQCPHWSAGPGGRTLHQELVSHPTLIRRGFLRLFFRTSDQGEKISPWTLHLDHLEGTWMLQFHHPSLGWKSRGDMITVSPGHLFMSSEHAVNKTPQVSRRSCCMWTDSSWRDNWRLELFTHHLGARTQNFVCWGTLSTGKPGGPGPWQILILRYL